MVTIYGNSFSIPCIKIHYACELIGVAYDWIHMDFAKGDHKTPQHIARHPAGKLPVIDDEGFLLFESDAICRYLNDKFGGSLLPAELQARAIVEQWNAYALNHVGLAMGKVLFNRVVAPTYGLPVDENSLREGLNWLANRHLPVVDQRLGESPHLGGDAISLADLSLLSALHSAEKADYSLTDYVHLTRWRTALQAQPFWHKVHGDEVA